MADPIRVLEECGQPARPLPPVFFRRRTVDLCCEDVRRLAVACKKLDVPATDPLLRERSHTRSTCCAGANNARLFWRENMKFLRQIADPQLIVDAEARSAVAD